MPDPEKVKQALAKQPNQVKSAVVLYLTKAGFTQVAVKDLTGLPEQEIKAYIKENGGARALYKGKNLEKKDYFTALVMLWGMTLNGDFLSFGEEVQHWLQLVVTSSTLMRFLSASLYAIELAAKVLLEPGYQPQQLPYYNLLQTIFKLDDLETRFEERPELNHQDSLAEFLRGIARNETTCPGTRQSFCMEFSRRYLSFARTSCLPPWSADIAVWFEEALAILSKRELSVIKMRYGLETGESKTMEAVARHFSVDRERIRQIEANAFRKLGHPNRNRKLKLLLMPVGDLLAQRANMLVPMAMPVQIGDERVYPKIDFKTQLRDLNISVRLYHFLTDKGLNYVLEDVVTSTEQELVDLNIPADLLLELKYFLDIQGLSLDMKFLEASKQGDQGGQVE
jgi:hypothetical protein